MKTPSTLWQKIERRVARYSARRNTVIKPDSGVVCFTFDDVQSSACTQGAAILEKHGVHGTFYVCGQLTGKRNYHTHFDLHRLANRGHELGSHGFAHPSYQTLGKAQILSDLRQNEAFFQELGYGTPESFAYPYGHVGLLAKRITGPMFVSSRGINPGINSRVVDLALMKAFPLYSGIWPEKGIAGVLEENAKYAGLTIFFSHGVESSPGPFDCSTELLEFAVRFSIAAGNKVLSVREALRKCSSSGSSMHLKR